MKKMILFAVLLCGCLPQQKLTGRVIDSSGPVPEAALLGMVWVEDAANAKPAPDTKDLNPEGRDMALEQDIKGRGLPAAYSRAFSGKDGWFTLDKLHFSAATRKAVAAMKEPRITRVTLWGFQRGYRKQAVTMFPKAGTKEIPFATFVLSKPENWKDLYVENTVDSLIKNYMIKGYSREFGATEQEKIWILEYTHSNLWKAYVESDIKGDKEMAEMCGRDYSDITVSQAGMQRNPEHERCAELKQRMGAVREIEELWIAHNKAEKDPLAAAKEVVRRAIALLPAETSEPKEYESMILAGLEDAASAQTGAALRNGLNDQSWQDTAIVKYTSGDKAASYRVLGSNLYGQLPEEVKQGVLTAQVSLNTIPGIKEKTAGFYLLMNRPLTAQLPNGDNGNHKDKPNEVRESTETAKGESLQELVGKLKTTTDQKDKHKLRMRILEYTPKNAADVKYLLDVAETEERGGDVQRDILRSLENIKDSPVGPVFYERMKKKSADPYVRAVSIGKLGGLKYKEAVPDMIKLVDDFDYENGRRKDESIVPLAAFYALGEIGDERAIPALMRKLGRMGSQDSQVIAKFGNKVLPQLMGKAKTSKDKQEKEAAYVSINAIKDEKAIPTLWLTLQEEKASRLRSACAGALLSTLTDKTTPTRKQLADYIFQEAQKDTEIFGMGYYAVVLARGNKDTDYLIRVLRDEKNLRNQRTDAIIALGSLKAQSAVSVLEDVLKWPDREFRMEAASALKKITGKDYAGGVK